MKNKTKKITESEKLEIYLEKLCLLQSAFVRTDMSEKELKKVESLAPIMRKTMAMTVGCELDKFRFQDYMLSQVKYIKNLKKSVGIQNKYYQTYGKETDNN